MMKLIILVVCFFALKAFSQTDLQDQDLIEMDSLTSETQQADTQADDVNLKDLQEPAENTPVPMADRSGKPARSDEILSKEEIAEKAEKELYKQPDPSFSTPVITSEEVLEDDRVFNPRKGHFISTFNFQGLQYEVPFEFQGEKKKFDAKKRSLFGGRLGIGFETYLGGGFNTTTKVEGYYVGTLFAKNKTAAPDVPNITFAYYKETGHVFGADLIQSIGYLHDMKSKTIMGETVILTLEPFVEGGIGIAQAYNRTAYHYLVNATSEDYRIRMRDNLLNTMIGAGFNVISSQSYFMQLKVTHNRFDITKRDFKGYSRPNGQPETNLGGKDNDAKISPITAVVLGGGYKF